MLTETTLARIVADKNHAQEIIRLAYEVAFEASIKAPEESSVDFVLSRMGSLQQIFEKFD